MIIDGKGVVFVRSDGTRASNSIGISGQTEDGEIMFFEIKDSLRPILEGKTKYQRIIVRRVFPCVETEDEFCGEEEE